MNNVWIFDIETFSNYFCLVAKRNDEILTFEICKWKFEGEELLYFLQTKPNLVGYNNIGFDGQILEYFIREKPTSAEQIYKFADKVTSSDESPYPIYDLSFNHLDLMALNNYGIYGKPTSLKWLEFTTRQKSIADLPYHHSEVLDIVKGQQVLDYCLKDVLMTEYFYGLCRNKIDMRKELVNRYDDKYMLNRPNSTIGEKILLYEYCKYTSKRKDKVKDLFTKPKRIDIKDIILPYIKFESKLFNEVLDEYKDLVLKANKAGTIEIKGKYSKKISFQNMTVDYALGGIHGCVGNGIYKSCDKYVIKTYDVAGMYPNVIIHNGFYPKHLGKDFVEVYKYIPVERSKYSKGSELNTAFKEAGNSLYGKSNARQDNFLKDPELMVKTTVNGQLLITMLGEKLGKIGNFIMWNTDGSEIIIPRDREDEYNQICNDWCKLTGMELEHANYDELYLRDVNSYIGKFDNGKWKRKGYMCIYEDYIGIWDKNPSATIIPLAIFKYFSEGIDPYETITNHDNIHDFLFGVKGGSSSEYWLFNIKDDSILNIEKRTERAVRFYVSNEGDCIMKFYTAGKKKGNLDSVPNTKGLKVKTLMEIGNENIFYKNGNLRYQHINYNYYIAKTFETINYIIDGTNATLSSRIAG